MAPAVAFASRGYHVLVEKPMAVTEDDCRCAFCVQRSLIIIEYTLMYYIKRGCDEQEDNKCMRGGWGDAGGLPCTQVQLTPFKSSLPIDFTISRSLQFVISDTFHRW